MTGRGFLAGTIAAASLMVAVPVASAATRHVVPTGGATTGDCTATPCTLHYAAETVAAAGDVVELAGGTYNVGNDPVNLKSGVTYQGAGTGNVRPVLSASPGSVFRGVTAVNVTLRDLRIVSSGGYPIAITTDAGGLSMERVTVRTPGSYNFTLACVAGTIRVRDSEFIAGIHGPELKVHGTCSAHIRNSLFDTGGADIFVDVGERNFNTSSTDVHGHLTLTIGNSIFDETPDVSVDTNQSTLNATIFHSRVDHLPLRVADGGGNIFTDAVFADRAAFDFHQLGTSPTRNAGKVDDHTSVVDIDGQTRPQGPAADIGPDEFVELPPVPVTGAAAEVTTTSATLTGTVDPNETPTTFHFEYGIAEPFTSRTASQTAGSGPDAVPVSAAVTGLMPGTIYRYRLVAENHSGTAAGGLEEFTTQRTPVQPPPPGPCANGIDDDGDGFTDARDPQCAAGRGQESPRDNPILACTGRAVILTDVLPATGRRVRLAGLADPTLAGRPVTFLAGTRAVGQSTVGADGSFGTRVPAPANRAARYSARIGALVSAAFKLDRSAIEARTSAPGRAVALAARVTARRRSGAKVELLLKRGCGRYVRVAQARLPKSGRFSIRTPAGTAAGAVVLRARITLPGGRRTYTLPRAATVLP